MDKSQIDAALFNAEENTHEAVGLFAKYLGDKLEALKEQARLSDMFPLAIAEVTKVAEFGAEKYKERGLAEEGFRVSVLEYLRRANKHARRWFHGERHDEETGCHPLAHDVVRKLAILNQELKDRKE